MESPLSTVSPALREVHVAAWAAVAARTDKITGERATIPPETPATQFVEESRYQDAFGVLKHLDTALTLAKQGPLAGLAELFEAVLPELRWSQNPSYNAENCTPEFLDGYAYASFSGPEGPILLEQPRGGFLLMGPGVAYPDHEHLASEVYLPLTGNVEWRLDQTEWFPVEAGELVRHRSFQPHATRAGDIPFLSFVGWLEPGDRASISFSQAQ
ncbi:MAG: dimethylsulfonioproprionate lyase family protein [Pseudomonadota bacterium]